MSVVELATPFLEGAREGRLMLQRWDGSDRAQLPPTMSGPPGSGGYEWVESTGRGVVLAFSVVHRAPSEEHAARAPYVYAAVRLEEGAQMISNVVGVDPSEVVVGMEVEVVFEREDAAGQPWPDFRPVGSPGASAQDAKEHV